MYMNRKFRVSSFLCTTTRLQNLKTRSPEVDEATHGTWKFPTFQILSFVVSWPVCVIRNCFWRAFCCLRVQTSPNDWFPMSKSIFNTNLAQISHLRVSWQFLTSKFLMATNAHEYHEWDNQCKNVYTEGRLLVARLASRFRACQNEGVCLHPPRIGCVPIM